MSLLKKIKQEQEVARVQADEAEQARLEETAKRRGLNQLVLMDDNTCPNCQEPTRLMGGTTYPLKVCIKCRVALPGTEPKAEEAAAEDESQTMEDQHGENVDAVKPVEDSDDDEDEESISDVIKFEKPEQPTDIGDD